MSESVSVSPAADLALPGGSPADRLEPRAPLGLPKGAWTQILIIAALFCALFRFNLVRLWGKTNPIDGQDANWQHSIFVPLIGLWYLYIHREELVAAAAVPVRREAGIRTLASFGLALMAVAVAFLVGAGVGWLGLILALTLVAVAPAGVFRMAGVDRTSTPDLVRWLGRGGIVAAVALLVTFGPALKFGAPAMAVLQAPVLLGCVIAAGMVFTALVPTSTVLGAVTMVGGLLTFAAAFYPIQNDYLKDIGMVVTLYGVTTLLGGWAVMRVAWFPIVFLVVALPWPELVYQRIANPLQTLAASASVFTLRTFGVDAQRDATQIWFMAPTARGGWEREGLNVEEACAGLRSLMTFLMLAGSLAFLQRRPLWEKVVITLSAIPIAIFCNMARVSGQGLFHRYVSKEFSQGFAHGFVGLAMIVPGFFLIYSVQWLIDKIFIEEADAAAARNRAASKRKIVEVPRKPALAAAAPTPAATAPAPAVAGAARSTGEAVAAAVPAKPQTAAAAPARPAAQRPPDAPAATPAKPTAVPAALKAAPAAAPAAPVKPTAPGALPPRPAARPAAAAAPAGSPAAAPARVVAPAGGAKPAAAPVKRPPVNADVAIPATASPAPAASSPAVKPAARPAAASASAAAKPATAAAKPAAPAANAAAKPTGAAAPAPAAARSAQARPAGAAPAAARPAAAAAATASPTPSTAAARPVSAAKPAATPARPAAVVPKPAAAAPAATPPPSVAPSTAPAADR